MPYPVLDTYMEWFIVDKHSPREMLALAKQYLSEYYPDNADDETIRRDIRRFVTMATRAQWKRQRFANSFCVMPFSIDPSELQWPCLQNGFAQELREI